MDGGLTHQLIMPAGDVIGHCVTFYMQVSFDLTGSNLVPWTEAANQTFASAIKFAIVRPS